jgi:hypothetical protein
MAAVGGEGEEEEEDRRVPPMHERPGKGSGGRWP